MPPDTQADGPGGPKARRTRGPASPGQRTAQPFGGTLNASPLRCAPGASAFRGRSATHAGRRTRGASALAGLPWPTRAVAAHGASASRRRSAGRGPRGASASRGHSAGRRTRGASVPADVRRPGRRSAASRRTRGASVLAAPAGLPQAAATRGTSASRRRSAAHAGRRTRGTSVLAGPRRRSAGVPQVAATRGASASRRRSAAHAGRRTRGTSVLAGPRRRSAASRRTRGLGLPRAFRRPPAGRRHAGGIGPRGHSAGLPQAAAHAGPRLPPSSPPAARFSRRPPCGIGPRMVYCT